MEKISSISELILLVLLSIKIIFTVMIIIFLLSSGFIAPGSLPLIIAIEAVPAIVYIIAFIGIFKRKSWGAVIAIVISAFAVIGWLSYIRGLLLFGGIFSNLLLLGMVVDVIILLSAIFDLRSIKRQNRTNPHPLDY